MLDPELLKARSEQEFALAPQLVPAELSFYEQYAWCLNPHLTAGQAIDHLREEIDRLATVPHGWQSGEVATNIALLACGILNSVDECLRGPSLRLPSRMASMRPARAARWTVEKVARLRPRLPSRLGQWRETWLAALHAFLSVAVAGETPDPGSLREAADLLMMAIGRALPSELPSARVAIPSPFRRLDLTHHDVRALAAAYAQRFPDRSQRILLVGLRTSGSYFAPLLRAVLEAEGYQAVSLITLAPGKGAGRLERAVLERCAAQGGTAVLVDDPPHTARTMFTAFEIARRAGFDRSRVKILAPLHPARRHWFKPLPAEFVVSLAPEDWYKHALLEPAAVAARAAEYFAHQGFVRASVVASRTADELTARARGASSDERGARLKRVFEVHLEAADGREERRFVLAKSVGWGWLGYHAFIAGRRLAGLVPPILGLRDGILYSEWIAPSAAAPAGQGRSERIAACARYIAARATRLALEPASATGMDLQRQDNGVRLLAQALSRAHGAVLADLLRQSRLERLLRRQACPRPALIDGNMRPTEWIVGPDGPLKTDYEHHGMGKEELNVVDPAYDLAATILEDGLSREEQSVLITRYVADTGDDDVRRRLFLNKLLAGLWAMKQAQGQMFAHAISPERQQDLHHRFMRAWDFLTVEAARYCGSARAPAATPRWRSPLVALDIDGVIDRRVFGFPCTTAAGVKALSLLNAGGFAVTLNTARSVSEVKAYCEAYSLAGGVAEHGSYMWDAVNGRGQILIGSAALRQLDELKRHLRRLPGVFLDERHQYSIRAFVYQPKPSGLLSALVKSTRSCAVGDGALAPLPVLLIQQLMATLNVDLLSFHNTTIDTTIVAKECNKGSGLVALRNWTLDEHAETVAVGDQEHDLTMFSVASRSFAPANIGCARQARLLGCRIVRRRYQRGLLEIACALTGRPHDGAGSADASSVGDDALFMDALRAADRPWATKLVAAALDPAALDLVLR